MVNKRGCMHTHHSLPVYRCATFKVLIYRIVYFVAGHDHGNCSAGGVCACSEDWFGDYCQIACFNGTSNSESCVCDQTCITGYHCHLECSAHGSCDNDGNCECDYFGTYTGDKCDEPSCPGWPNPCEGHGTCNEASGECDCEPFWYGVACQIPDCTGTPDCNGVNSTCKEPPLGGDPRCFDCEFPYTGDSCEYKCIHGSSIRSLDGVWTCSCDLCYYGVACDTLCSEHGSCVNGTCDCGFDGYRGDFCQTKGCPGYDVDCTGHGNCNSFTSECLCNQGWEGIGCQTAYCPQDCNGAGSCDVINNEPQCTCNSTYFGTACQFNCGHGSYNGETCDCDPCYGDFYCTELCSGTGNCTDADTCDCGFNGGRGDYCQLPGCSGWEENCGGNGECNAAEGTCTCLEGWKGDGCEQPDCPDDCNFRGTCNTSLARPKCTGCDIGWMGKSCNEECNGIQDPMDSGICACLSSCNSGDSCDIICDGNGMCVNETCVCNEAYWGDTCKSHLCPGVGESCSSHGKCNPITHVCRCNAGWSANTCGVPNCPGDPDCNGNGTCSTDYAIPKCICNDGWTGVSCSKPCVHGTAQEDYSCVCDPCYSGIECDLLCGDHGTCSNHTCTCDTAWWGKFHILRRKLQNGFFCFFNNCE